MCGKIFLDDPAAAVTGISDMQGRTSKRLRSAALAIALLGAVLALAPCRDMLSVVPVSPAFESPVRMASPDATSLFVTDYGIDSVCALDRATLVPASCFAIAGKPLGIAATADRIFVGNETLHTVEVYDRRGTKISDLPGTFSTPASLAVDDQTGLLFVLDTASKTITLLTYAGYPVRTITGDLAGNGKLVNPVALAVDPVRQEVLVSDYGDVASSFPLYPARVRIYDYNGTFITVISGSTGGFSRPQGLDVHNDHIFVTDSMVGKVLLFTRLSSTLTATAGALGSFGDGPGQLMLPLDVLVEPSTGDVLVTNNRPGRIERFEKGGLIP